MRCSLDETGARARAPEWGHFMIRRRVRLLLVTCALLMSAAAFAGPADAATLTNKWTATIGSNAYNGTAVVKAYSIGSGSLVLAMKRLARSTTYSRAIYRGTCSSLSTKVVTLGSVVSTSTGTLARTTTITAAQSTLLKRSSSLVIRLVGGSHVYCARLVKVALTTSSTGGTGSGYPAPPGWDGTSDVDCPDFATHAQAQAFFNLHSPGTDPHGLDADHDGLACESLP
jgi:hypothetical protein